MLLILLTTSIQLPVPALGSRGSSSSRSRSSSSHIIERYRKSLLTHLSNLPSTAAATAYD